MTITSYALIYSFLLESHVSVFAQTSRNSIYMNVLKDSVRNFNSLNQSEALSFLDDKLTTFQNIFETYLKYQNVKVLTKKTEPACSLYILHSLVTPQNFLILQKLMNTIIMRVIKDRFDSELLEYVYQIISDILLGLNMPFLKNMALKSGDPLENGFSAVATKVLLNKKLPKICTAYFKKIFCSFRRTVSDIV